MSASETPLVFDCLGERLVGVLSLPAQAACDVGVVIVVGGPQYRAGSHRQFTLLARRLAAGGYPVLRFDVRGMGDSTGEFPGFELLQPDIEAAAQALREGRPGVRRVVIWGLCDAASAALIASRSAGLPLAGVVLLNPWVRHARTQVRTEVRQYYGRRVFERAFWRKLLAGRVDVLGSARELGSKLARMTADRLRPPAAEPPDYRERMAQAALAFAGPQLYVLAGQDHVCAEFLDYAGSHPALKKLWSRATVQRCDIRQADHTFSSAQWRREVEEATVKWLDTQVRR